MESLYPCLDQIGGGEEGINHHNSQSNVNRSYVHPLCDMQEIR